MRRWFLINRHSAACSDCGVPLDHGEAVAPAAGGIAVIGMGNLGGFLAPNLKVWADANFGSQHAGLYLLAGLTILNAGLIALVKDRRAAKSAT